MTVNFTYFRRLTPSVVTLLYRQILLLNLELIALSYVSPQTRVGTQDLEKHSVCNVTFALAMEKL